MKFLTIYPNIRDDTFLHASEFFSNDSSTDRRRDISIHSNVQSLTQVLQKRSVCRYKTFHTIKTSFLHLSIPLYSLFHVSDLFDPLATVLLLLLLLLSLSLSLSLCLSLSLSLSLSVRNKSVPFNNTGWLPAEIYAVANFPESLGTVLEHRRNGRGPDLYKIVMRRRAL